MLKETMLKVKGAPIGVKVASGAIGFTLLVGGACGGVAFNNHYVHSNCEIQIQHVHDSATKARESYNKLTEYIASIQGEYGSETSVADFVKDTGGKSVDDPDVACSSRADIRYLAQLAPQYDAMATEFSSMRVRLETELEKIAVTRAKTELDNVMGDAQTLVDTASALVDSHKNLTGDVGEKIQVMRDALDAAGKAKDGSLAEIKDAFKNVNGA